MIRRTRRKARWVRVATVCCVGLVVVVITATKLSMQRTRNMDALANSDAVKEAVAQFAHPAAPSETRLPENWSGDDSIRCLNDEAYCDTLERVVRIGDILLMGRDTPRVIEGVPSSLGDLLEQIGDARQNGTIAPIEERIDLDRYDREEVLAALDEFLGSLTWLREMGAGLERGLVSIPDARSEARSSSHSSYWLVSSLLECRAVLEVRRGEVDTGLRSYLEVAQVGVLLSAAGDLGWQPSGRWPTAAIADFAWRRAPLTESQRALVFRALTPPVPMGAEIGADLYREIAEMRKRDMDRIAAQYPNLLDIFNMYRAAHLSRKEYDIVEAQIQELTQILNRPPHEAVPVLREMVLSESIPARRRNDVAGSAARLCLLRSLDYGQAEIARLAFALKDYRRDHGAYPTDVEALTRVGLPPLPIDPLTGRPMLYDSDGKGFSIYLPERPPIPPDTPDRVKRLYARPANGRVSMWRALE